MRVKEVKVDYVIVNHYQLITETSYEYGLSANSGRDDRDVYILQCQIPGKPDVYIEYDEGVYSYECTRNEDGFNTLFFTLPDDDTQYYVEVPSHTTDFHKTLYSSYEEILESIRKIEEFGYYRVIED